MKKALIICLFFISCKQTPQKAGIKTRTHAEQISNVLPKYTDVIATEITKQEFDKSVSSYHNPIILDSATFASVKGKTSLPLKNGSRVFMDNVGVPYDENIVTYKYRGRMKAINSYVVEVHLYEDHFFLLINTITGKQDTLNGFPFLSPDKHKIFCSQYNPYETYENTPPPTQDVEIHFLNSSSIGQIIRKPFKSDIDYAYWKDSNTLYTKAASDQGKLGFKYHKLQLTEK